MKSDPGDDDLSRAENAIIDQTYRELGHKSQWDVVEMTHTFPEWNDPGKSSEPILYDDVLRVDGFSRAERDDILENIAMQADIWTLSRVAKVETAF